MNYKDYLSIVQGTLRMLSIETSMKRPLDSDIPKREIIVVREQPQIQSPSEVSILYVARELNSFQFHFFRCTASHRHDGIGIHRFDGRCISFRAGCDVFVYYFNDVVVVVIVFRFDCNFMSVGFLRFAFLLSVSGVTLLDDFEKF